MRVGTLIVDLAANVARLQQDMASAKDTVSGAMSNIKSTVNDVKGAFETLGVALSAGAFVASIKGALEMEAGLNNLAQRAGSTVEAISSLSMVAKSSNTDMDTVAATMSRLSKSMAEAGDGTTKAGKVFDALKISTTDATGAMRPAQDVMQELGQKLMAMKDQTLAVAFAQEVLGKNGAALLPFLYELAQAGQLHAKVTTDQALAAKKFEDGMVTLTASFTAAKVALANEMLPTLQTFLDQMNEGIKIAGGFGSAMMLFGVRMSPDYTLQQAQTDLTQMQQFRSTATPGQMFTDRMGHLVGGDIDTRISDLQKVVQFLSYQRAQQISAGLQGQHFPEDVIAGAKTGVANPLGAAANQTDYYTPLLKASQDRIAQLGAEAAATGPLTEAQKTLVKLQSDLLNGYVKLTPEQAKEIKSWLDEQDALELAKRSLADWNKLMLENFNRVEQYNQQQQTATDAMKAENQSLKDHNEEIGLSTTQLDALKVRRLDDAIAAAEQKLAMESVGNEFGVFNQQLSDQIDLLKQRRDLMVSGQFAQAAVDSAKQAEDAFKKTANTIDHALTTAITNGLFESFTNGSKSGAQILVSTIQNALKTAVFEPIIRAIISPVSSSIASLLPNYGGASTFAGAGGGVAGIGNVLSGAGSIGNFFSGGASSLATSVFGPSSFGAAAAGDAFLPAALGADGAGAAGIGSLLGGASSFLGPIGLAVGAASLLGLFGGGGGPKQGTAMFTNSNGYFQIELDNIPGANDAANASIANSYIAALNDPSQYDPAILAQFLGTTVNANDAQSGVSALLSALAPAAQAATSRTATQQAALQAALGNQSALATSIGSFQSSQQTASYLAPMDQFAGAQAQFQSTLAAAQAGDPTAIQGIGSAASNLLSIGRTVYASGPKFADLMKTVNSQLGDLLQKSSDANTAAINAVPTAIKTAAQSQIDAINQQTHALSAKFDALSQDVRQLAQAVA